MEMDLAEGRQLMRYNRFYPYVLCVIDSFTKYLFVEPMKTKTANETAGALERIIQRSGRFERIVSDDGSYV